MDFVQKIKLNVLYDIFTEDEVKEHEFEKLVTEHIGNLGINISSDKLVQVSDIFYSVKFQMSVTMWRLLRLLIEVLVPQHSYVSDLTKNQTGQKVTWPKILLAVWLKVPKIIHSHEAQSYC